jgi:hypothetical protein
MISCSTGLRVAIEVAMIPIPGSTVLQIAKSVVAPNGILICVADGATFKSAHIRNLAH